MDIKISNPDDEVVCDEEKRLSEVLRSLCSFLGEEKRENLLETAKVLMDMGKLYLTKARNTEGKLQKITFIRCCALLTGAKVRFVMKKCSEMLKKTNTLLKELSDTLLETVPFKGVNMDLNVVSGKIHKELSEMRAAVNEKLGSVVHLDKRGSVSDLSPTSALLAEEVQKVNEISNLTKECTKNFKKLMLKIAGYCTDILGSPPHDCAFALLGLGSLAREEVTLYSDFEHVIVLENLAKKKGNFPDIQEYFRWYAVVFQVIIIGLGETFIRSVGVRSINNLYSNDKSANWFLDNFTPCGIAFDGMVPHSCNNPLGRIETSQLKKEKVELIQTSCDMAKYLSSSEHLKNGYYLKDILVRTCLVHGSAEVYCEYIDESKKILDREYARVTLDQAEEVKKNFNEYVYSHVPFRPTAHKNYKTALYRPVTAILAYLARISKLTVCSSFDIVTELCNRDVIAPNHLHLFKYAVAIACEVRMKVYADTGHQRRGITVKEFIRMAGESSALNGFYYLDILRKTALGKAMFWSKGGNQSPIVVNEYNMIYLKSFTLFRFGYFRESAELARKGLEMIEIAARKGDDLNMFENYYSLCSMEGLALVHLSEKEPENQRTLCLRAAVKLAEVRKMPQCPAHLISISYSREIEAFMKCGKLKEAKALLHEWHNLHLTSDEMKSREIMNLPVIRELENKIMSESHPPNILYIKYLTEKLDQETDFLNKVKLMVDLIKCKQLQKSLANCKVLCREMVDYVKRNPSQIKNRHHIIINALHDVFKVQNDHGWIEDGLKTVQTILEFTDRDAEMCDEYYFETHEIAILVALERYSDCITKIVAVENDEARKKLAHILDFCEASLENRVSKKMKLMERSWESCQKGQHLQCARGLWSQTVHSMLHCSVYATDDDNLFNRVCDYFERTPVYIKQVLQTKVWCCNLLYSQFLFIRHDIAVRKYDSFRPKLVRIFRVFNDSLMHPTCFSWYMSLIESDFVYQDEIVCSLIASLGRTFYEKYTSKGNSKLSKAYNDVIKFFVTLKETCANELWRIINRSIGINSRICNICIELLCVILLKKSLPIRQSNLQFSAKSICFRQ